MILTCVKRTNTKIQIHKYANTQIQQMIKCHKDLTCGIFLKKEVCSGVSNMTFTCDIRSNTKIQIRKYANTQIQQMVKCHEDPTCCIFLKRGLFRDIKNDIGYIMPTLGG